jgi:predicted outer membrane repeat protein
MNLNDAGTGSLRQAIIDEPAGGTVNFDPSLSGTIALTTGTLVIAKDLTITGPGASVITVSGNNALQVFNISGSFMVTISGLTIENGSSMNGGGIGNAGTLTVDTCIVTNNKASANGGGIYSTGVLTVLSSADSCKITNNQTTGMNAPGGGIYSSGVLTVRSTTAQHKSLIAGNIATGNGGGLYSTADQNANHVGTLNVSD